jgi:uncharacterized alpha-E superfamily protein
VDVYLNLMLEAPAGQKPSWEPLVLTTGDHAWFVERYGDFGPEQVTQFLTFDRQYPNSILSSLASARENARTVRDIISREMWQELNEFYLKVVEASETKVSVGEMSDFFSKVKLRGIYFEGVQNATLSRGEAWHFARLGRMLERADKTSRILDVKYFILLPAVRDVGTTIDQLGWDALLSSASALQMFRQRYHTTAPTSVAEFLLLDPNFPRSIRYCVGQAQLSLHAITGSPIGTHRNAAERSLGQIKAQLDYESVGDVMRIGLHEYLDRVQIALNQVDTELARALFHADDGGQIQQQ